MNEDRRGVGENGPLLPTEVSPQSLSDIIRTETVISRLPRHILAKSGKRPEIRIERFTPDGKLALRWVVSFNELYGPARQLAYDLDTLIVERAIEETFKDARRAGQPLPRLIPIGSLRDLCRKLNLEENGTNAAKIKRALQQNAGAVINTILSYTAIDKTEFTIDGTFTCYGVFFTGKKLPDGRKADQIYISTTNEYHQVISTAPTRPLDYNYKLQLAPTPRRLYEILSFPMYGAISNGEPFAKLLYSDYCTRAPHVRYFSFDQVKKQMFKVNKPHRESGYISSMKYQYYPDTHGNPDWWLLYAPGPKAYADFEIAHPKRKIQRIAHQGLVAGQGAQPKHQDSRPARHETEIASILQSGVDPNIIAEFTKRGIPNEKAMTLLANRKPGQDVVAQLELIDKMIDDPRYPVTNPTGFYIRLIERNIEIPDGFETSAQRKRREESERKERELREREEAREALEWEYDAYCQDLTDRYIAENPARFETIKEGKRTEERRLRPSAWPDLIESYATTQAKSAMRNELTLPTLKEFLELKKQGTDFSLKPVAVPPATPAEEPAAVKTVKEPQENPVGDAVAEVAVGNLATESVLEPAPAAEIGSHPDGTPATAELAAQTPEPASNLTPPTPEASEPNPATGAIAAAATEAIDKPVPEDPGDGSVPPTFA